ETSVDTLQAEGARVWECRAGSDGKLAWVFREPIATLLLDGKTVGRHYAGPNWEHADGSAVVGKAVANVAGKTASDIPWLKLEVTAHRGSGLLSGVTTVQRINTQGGVHAGACDKASALHSAPYAADYVFRKKGWWGVRLLGWAKSPALADLLPRGLARFCPPYPPPRAPSIALSAASALEPSGPPACAMSARPPPPLPPSASAPLRT